jgi:hypothetical protein
VKEFSNVNILGPNCSSLRFLPCTSNSFSTCHKNLTCEWTCRIEPMIGGARDLALLTDLVDTLLALEEKNVRHQMQMTKFVPRICPIELLMNFRFSLRQSHPRSFKRQEHSLLLGSRGRLAVESPKSSKTSGQCHLLNTSKDFECLSEYMSAYYTRQAIFDGCFLHAFLAVRSKRRLKSTAGRMQATVMLLVRIPGLTIHFSDPFVHFWSTNHGS